MKILLTGSTGYIGRRLLPILVSNGHHVICLVRDERRFDYEDFDEAFMLHVEVIEADLTLSETLSQLPKDIDAAYFLVHSMSSTGDFSKREQVTAQNFADYLSTTKLKQCIYLSGITNEENLSEHLASRKNVEDILRTSHKPLTVLRAAIIIGSGSASFEIIRDLVEKLPVMVAPKWLSTKCQPIGIRNVIEYLEKILLSKATFDRTFDIGGPDVLTYKEMLLGFAKARKLLRLIITVPIMTPKFSSLWLYFVTSTSYPLARNLVSSMKNEVICENNDIQDIVPLYLYCYRETLELAFSKINQKNVISSWKDTISEHTLDRNFLDYIEVPKHGCLHDRRVISFQRKSEVVKQNIWEIGGSRGWYFGNQLWRIRGFIDKIVGGVGLRRGRRSPSDLKPGDALDFWRVLLADETNCRLLLYAEMKLPGEAWLEFRIKENQNKKILVQTATFRPLGLWGRLYWYLMLPFHAIIFPKMAKNIVNY